MKISIILIATFSVFATILNIEGMSCLSKVNSLLNEQQKLEEKALSQQQQQQSESQQVETQSEEEIRESFGLINYCFLVTNLYVYSLFGIIIGVIIIAVWYIKYKKVWSNIIKRNK